MEKYGSIFISVGEVVGACFGFYQFCFKAFELGRHVVFVVNNLLFVSFFALS